MPGLRLVDGQAPRKWHLIGPRTVTIGRDATSDVRLEPDQVSRHHAEIICKEEQYFVVDLGSRNQTFVNNEEIESNTPRQLAEGDEVRICTFVFEFTMKSVIGDDVAKLETSVHKTASDEDSGSLSSLSILLDSSSESCQERTSQNAEAKLAAMMQIARELHNALALDTVLERVLDCLLNIFPQANYAVILLNEAELSPARELVKQRNQNTEESIFISATVLEHVVTSGKAVVSDDVRVDDRFSDSQSVMSSPQRSIMCAPLVDMEGNSLGAIQLDAKNKQSQFASGDLDLLASVALQISLAVVDSRLHEAVVRQRDMQRDLEVAQEIQLGLLPTTSPQIQGYEFYDYYLPAKFVGGDYYDYIQLSDDKLAIVIGDVAGKGVAAAILMAKLGGEMRVHLATGREPVDVFQEISRSFGARSSQWRFVTAILAVLDTKNHTLRIVNAGHMRPVRRRADGTVEELGEAESGVPLGVLPEMQYRAVQFDISPGDMFVMYSDGVSDATNPNHQVFETTGVLECIRSRGGGAMEFGRFMIQSVAAFTGNHPQIDDMCLLCVSRDSA